jgi:hypothetical protein
MTDYATGGKQKRPRNGPWPSGEYQLTGPGNTAYLPAGWHYNRATSSSRWKINSFGRCV